MASRGDIYLSRTSRRFGIMQNASKSERIYDHTRTIPGFRERASNALVTHCEFVPSRAPHLTHARVTSTLMYNDYVSALLRTRLRANAFSRRLRARVTAPLRSQPPLYTTCAACGDEQ